MVSDATHNSVYSGEVHPKLFDGQSFLMIKRITSP